MTTSGHKHEHHRKDVKHADKKLPWSRLHKDWRTWLVIGLMLAAMGIYVLTLDESIQPGSGASSAPPAPSQSVQPRN
jgi:hypothetical protein